MLTYGKTMARKDGQSFHSFPAGVQQKPQVSRRLWSLVKVGDVLQAGEPFRHKHIEEIPLRPGDTEHLDGFELSKYVFVRSQSPIRQSAVKYIQMREVWEETE